MKRARFAGSMEPMPSSPRLSLPGRRFALAAAACALLAVPLAQAGPEQQMTVTAVVRHFSNLKVVAQPRSFHLSAEDVARGYVDIAAPLQLELESNLGAGYTLVFGRAGQQVLRAQVQGLGQRFEVAADTPVTWRLAGRREQAQFRFRLILAQGVQAGEYAWPIQVSLLPL
jgi:hypothetical protein